MIRLLDLEPDLLSAVQSRLYAGQFTDAVKAAFLHLTETLRETSGRDGDGHDLIGQVLNGNDPIVRLNRFQSESDKNEQKGWAELTRGLYTGIRNPRSHSTWEDTEDWCIRVLIMIDAVLKMLERAVPKFNPNEMVQRMVDPHFVADSGYATQLAREVPEDALVVVFEPVFATHLHGDVTRLRHATFALVERMSGDQRKSVGQLFSEALQAERDESTIAKGLAVMPSLIWSFLDIPVQLRIENMIVEAVKKGRIKDGMTWGSMGRWAVKFGRHFNHPERVVDAIENRLSVDWFTQNYIGEYFLPSLPTLISESEDVSRICRRLAYAALGNEARVVQNNLGEIARTYPALWKQTLLDSLRERAESNRSMFEKLEAQLLG